jgi:hypothetical protein
MLTALESFLTMKSNNHILKTNNDDDNDTFLLSKTEAMDMGDEEVKSVKCINPKKSKINTTMASFFAPLPVITSVPEENVNNNAMMVIASNNNNTQQAVLNAKNDNNVWHVARYGRIYKRKAHSKVGYSHIPCPPGYRYCKECQKPMPLDKFYTNVKRYICRHHHYLRVNKRFRERVMTSDFEKMAEIAWLDLFRFCPMLGYAKAEYDRHDIKDLVINTKIPLSVAPRAIPIDPSIPMRPRNVAIVSSANMNILVKVFVMTCSRAQYILMVQSCNLLPTNADAGVPWAPFHNPEYIRQDIDVIPILEKEKSMPKELPHVEAIWELMKEDEEKVNECKNRLGRDSDHQSDADETNTSIYVEKNEKDKNSSSETD